MKKFATEYTAAWCSQNPDRVAAHFAVEGSISVNGSWSNGRIEITEMVRGFMTAFPDMMLTMDKIEPRSDGAVFHWTFVGTNTGPGGGGKSVRFSGYEEWAMGDDRLIKKSLGHFDAEEYEYQLAHGLE